MGWFDEQLRQRMRDDEESLDIAYANLSSVVLGRAVLEAALDDQGKAENAFEEILHYFHLKPREIADEIRDPDMRMEALLHPAGVMRRTVKLTGNWFRDGMGPLLGTTNEGYTVALIPGKFSGYTYHDYAKGKRVKVTARNQNAIAPEAVCFYRPLPGGSLTPAGLYRYIFSNLTSADVLLLALATLFATLLGLLTPYATRTVFEQIVPSGRQWLLGSIGGLLVGGAVGTLFITILRNLMVERLRGKISVATEAALMARVISLPTAFFKQYSAGELANRAAGVGQLCTLLSKLVFSVGFTVLFALLYLVQIAAFAPVLALPALAMTAATLAWLLFTAKIQSGVIAQKLEAEAKLEGLVHAFYTGIQKLRLTGAESRAFGKWAAAYQESARLTYDPPLPVKLANAGQVALSMAGTILLYFCALRGGVSGANYLAFSSAYGHLSAVLLTLGPAILTLGNAAPVLKLLRPVLAAKPEVSGEKRVVSRLSGSIELNNVSFRYREDMPLILDNLSLKIRPGQYVAIVGATGCGKSTLLRILLGFEQPQKGAVYYDGKDLQALDLQSVRRQIGVVLQNGALLTGSIFDNIAVAATGLTMDDAWVAAEAAGIADDIRDMPMGMHTVITEGGGGISGGQKQRLMIARAIAAKPKLLMLDEATSALDNITQQRVSEALNALKSTRVVIAHRLSTIRQCDRILVLDKGRIIEDGTYEELLNQNGFFAELVARQRLDCEEKNKNR